MAQLGSALRSGRRGRRFKSCHPDASKGLGCAPGPLVVFRYVTAGAVSRQLHYAAVPVVGVSAPLLRREASRSHKGSLWHPWVMDSPLPAETAALSPEDAVDFWDQRHREKGDGSSGGSVSLGEQGNHAFYAIRAGQLLDLAGGSSARAPMDVLDAGCGKGIFARAMTESGYRVTAFDPSEAAITHCQRLARLGDRENYSVATMTSFRPTRLFDLVYAIDVLFHIMNDGEWEDSVRTLCGWVRFGGRIALVDSDHQQARQWARYQKTRPPQSYGKIFADCGFEVIGSHPCGPKGFPNRFNIARRVR